MEIPTPSDNPITVGKIKLGEQLFFDKRLSKAKSMSCESCHVPEKAWTDGLVFSKKFDGTLNKRHTPTLCGVAFYPELYWDGRVTGLGLSIVDVPVVGVVARSHRSGYKDGDQRRRENDRPTHFSPLPIGLIRCSSVQPLLSRD